MLHTDVGSEYSAAGAVFLRNLGKAQGSTTRSRD